MLIGAPRGGLARYAPIALIALSFLVLLAPFCFFETPPLTDYPNHLARYWLIAGGAHDPILARFYQIDWSNAVTNIGVDRVIALFSPLASGLIQGHIAIIVAAILPPLGILTLSYAVSRRFTAWQVIFPFAAWSTTFLMGFVNFQIGLGLALLFASIDPLVQPRLWKGVVWMRVPFGLVLAVDHLFSLIFYAILLAGLALGPSPFLADAWRDRGRRLWQGGLTAAWCLIPLAILAGPSQALPGAQPPTPISLGANIGAILFNAATDKLATLLSPLASYNVFQEITIVLALAGFLIWLNRRRALTAHGGLMVAFAGMAALAVLAPGRLAGASWVDRRFPIMALCCVMAAVQFRPDVPRRFGLLVGCVALSLVGLQTAWVGWNWGNMKDETKAVRDVLANVPAGATILPMQHKPTLKVRSNASAGRYMFLVGDPTFRHMDTMAVPLRRAFVPNLFSARGLQPLRVLGSWDGVVEHNGGDLASVAALSRSPRPGDPSYVAGWRGRFDYVLVLNADMPDWSGPFRPPPELTLVADRGFAQLWRVARRATP